MTENKSDGREAIALLAVIPATVAAIGGFVAGGPLGAAAAGAGTWAGVYALLEPVTRPTNEPRAPVRPTYSTPRELSDDEFRKAYGTPAVHWDSSQASYGTARCDYGPVSLTHEGITWRFYWPTDATISILVRVAGGEGYAFAMQLKLCEAVQIVAARKFQAEAQRAVTRAQNARKAEADERERIAAIERAAQQRKYYQDQAAREELAAHKREEEARLRAEQQARWQREEEQRRIAREAREARLARLNSPIPLTHREGKIVIGTDVGEGNDVTKTVRKFQHMLVGGMTGSGKSVLLHQLAYQLLRSADVERVVLIDLKGGTEFDRYRAEPKAQVLWEFGDVVRVFDELVALLDAREAVLRSKGLRDWNGGRVFVIVDEYAEIHDSIHDARRGEEKDNAQRLANNLKRIIRRARSLGVVMICALQKPTTDAMDSTLKANMNFRVCLRVKTRQSAEATLDAFEELPVNPLSLSKGRFVFDDGQGDGYYHLQAQIAPGVELGDVS